VVRRYIILINFIFIILSLFLANRIYKIWTSNEYQHVAQGTEQNQGTFPEPTLNNTKRSPRRTYQDIVNKDLFRPERTEWQAPVEEKEAQTVSKTAPKVDVYGIVISNSFKYAWIKGRGKKDKSDKVSEGETIQEWKVSAITPHAVSLSKGEESIEYKLIEPGKPKQRTIPKSLVPPKPASKQAKRPSKKRQPAKPLQRRTKRTPKERK
jgi:hypothetical protein